MTTQIQSQDLDWGVATPGNYKYYGTDGAGVKAFQDLLTQLANIGITPGGTTDYNPYYGSANIIWNNQDVFHFNSKPVDWDGSFDRAVVYNKLDVAIAQNGSSNETFGIFAIANGFMYCIITKPADPKTWWIFKTAFTPTVPALASRTPLFDATATLYLGDAINFIWHNGTNLVFLSDGGQQSVLEYDEAGVLISNVDTPVNNNNYEVLVWNSTEVLVRDVSNSYRRVYTGTYWGAFTSLWYTDTSLSLANYHSKDNLVYRKDNGALVYTLA